MLTPKTSQKHGRMHENQWLLSNKEYLNTTLSRFGRTNASPCYLWSDFKNKCNAAKESVLHTSLCWNSTQNIKKFERYMVRSWKHGILWINMKQYSSQNQLRLFFGESLWTHEKNFQPFISLRKIIISLKKFSISLKKIFPWIRVQLFL